MDIHQSNAGTFVKPEPLEGMVLPPPQQSAMSEWDQLRQRAEEDCFNESAWDALIDYAEDSGDNEKIKQAYDALLQKYPNTVRTFVNSRITVTESIHSRLCKLRTSTIS